MTCLHLESVFLQRLPVVIQLLLLGTRALDNEVGVTPAADIKVGDSVKADVFETERDRRGGRGETTAEARRGTEARKIISKILERGREKEKERGRE